MGIIKTFLFGGVAGLLAILGAFFYQRGNEIETLESENDNLKFEVDIGKGNLEVLKKENKAKEQISKMEYKILKENTEIETKSQAKLEIDKKLINQSKNEFIKVEI